MIDLKTIYNIYKDGVYAIKTDSSGHRISSNLSLWTFRFLWFVLPLIIIATVFCREIKISFLQNFIGSSIALFTGLFFSLLLRIGDKIRVEKNNQDRDNDNFQKFKESLFQISKISQLIILIGIKVFILLILNWLVKSDSLPIVELTITSIVFLLLTWYLIALIALIQRFTYTMRDEIDNIL